MKVSDIPQHANTMQQLSQTNASKQSDQHQNPQEVKDRSPSMDKVEFSDRSREMQKIYDVLQMTPETRAEKVSTLKKMIQEGTYQVENEALAEKLIKDSILDLIK